jgi:glycosyltransferase involved in cell wall biosynthesis
MRVLLVNKFYYLAGGAERYVFEWQRLLHSRGHETAVFSMRHPRNAPSPYFRWFVSEVDFAAPGGALGRLRAAAKAIYSFEARARLRDLLRHWRPDVAHVHSYCYQLTPSIFGALRDADVPVAQTAHEYYHVCANQHLYDAAADRVCERCRRGRLAMLSARCVKASAAATAAAWAARMVDDGLRLSRWGIRAVIAPSRFMRSRLVAAGWPQSRVTHVPNFVDTDAIRPVSSPGDYMLFVGRLVGHKGVRTLLEAAAHLPHVPLKIAGDGPLMDEAQACARRLGRGDVEFAGFRDGEDLRRLVAGSRAVVTPSEWYENAPLVILEAMAAGRAVIASDIGGIGEQVRHGREGLLFPAGDAQALVACMHCLWDNPSEAVSLGAQGRRRAEEAFSAAEHYRRVMRVFRGMLV